MVTAAQIGTSLWAVKQGWMASGQQPGSWWREQRNSGAEQRQSTSSDRINPFVVLGKDTREKKKIGLYALFTPIGWTFWSHAIPYIWFSSFSHDLTYLTCCEWKCTVQVWLPPIHSTWSTYCIPLPVNSLPVPFEILVFLIFFRDSDKHC